MVFFFVNFSVHQIVLLGKFQQIVANKLENTGLIDVEISTKVYHVIIPKFIEKAMYYLIHETAETHKSMKFYLESHSIVNGHASFYRKHQTYCTLYCVALVNDFSKS